VGQGQHLFWRRISLCEIRPPIPPKKRAVRARAWRKEGGVGGIPPRPSRSEAFPQFGVKPNIKAKQFSTPFKKNLAGGR